MVVTGPFFETSACIRTYRNTVRAALLAFAAQFVPRCCGLIGATTRGPSEVSAVGSRW